MKAGKLSDAAIAAFKRNYDQLVAGVTGLVGSRAKACSCISLDRPPTCTWLTLPCLPGLRVRTL